MRRKVVAMPVIPGQLHRRSRVRRSDLDHARFSQATWQWWCARHGIEFLVLDRPLGDGEHALMPPTFQRWLAPEPIIRERGEDTVVAVVDADTMVRWDTPDFLEDARGFSAVRASNPLWIADSIDAFQPLFPDVSLPWWQYFNAGLVVVGAAQLHILRTLLSFAASRWPELEAVMRSGDVGTDQTPLNFILRREREQLRILPPPFNYQHCFPMNDALHTLEEDPVSNPGAFAAEGFSQSWAFQFIKLAYVWHFTNVVTHRSLVMQEVWRRVAGHYPGATVDGVPRQPA
jgi:hypothetical protein